MDTRPVFVLLTAETCGGCRVFKRNWPTLKNRILQDGKVQVVEIEVPTPGDKPDPTQYHKDLGRFIGWYPTMSLFPADRWNNHNSELIGVVKNGKILPPSDGLPERTVPIGTPKFDHDDIMKWIDYTINKHSIFVNNKSQPQLIVTDNNKPLPPPPTTGPPMSAPNSAPAPSNDRYSNGNYKVPTAAAYYNAKPSRVQ